METKGTLKNWLYKKARLCMNIGLITFLTTFHLTSFAQRAEDPAITHIVDELFGKGIQERLTGKRPADKARYAELERQLRDLVSQLNNTDEIIPRDEAERAAFKLIELKRDRKLAEVDYQYAAFKKGLLKMDPDDPQTLSYIDIKEARFKESRQYILNTFEEEIRREYKRRNYSLGVDDIKKRIRDIEYEQRKIANALIYRSNRRY